MHQSAETPARATKEKTFSAYNEDRGKAYASIRRNYHPSVYQAILDHHNKIGAQFDTLVDVGCGPGTATRNLSPYFNQAIGLDPSEGMIKTARSLGGSTATSESIQFHVSTAEDIGSNLESPIKENSVDLIIAANAAHWFDLEHFWPRAARMLKKGGSVALWTSGDVRAHSSMPNAAAIQNALDEHFEQHLKPFAEPGNLLARGRYVDLPLPWDLSKPVDEFDQSSFYRKEWGSGDQFHAGEPEVDMDAFEAMMGTGSAVSRWRETHPDAVGTQDDVVRLLRREFERLLHEAGVKQGEETVKGTAHGALLMLKKL